AGLRRQRRAHGRGRRGHVLGRRRARGGDGGSAEQEPTVVCAGPEEWRAWLEEHHAGEQGAWLKIAKKGSGIASVSHAEALDVAICFGWIDGARHAHGHHSFPARV